MIDVRIFRNEETFREWAIYYGPEFLRVKWWRDHRGDDWMDLHEDTGQHIASVFLRAFNKHRIVDIVEELNIEEYEERGAV